MSSYRIVSARSRPEHLPAFYRWCIDEWGRIDEWEPADEDVPAPVSAPEDTAGGRPAMASALPPLFAVDGEELLGGLLFSIYASPETALPAHWINAVVVAPVHRRRGLGTALIRAAEAAARAAGVSRLYALTDLPVLYERLDWSVCRHDDSGTVVRRAIDAAS